ncbi:MAG: energy-coupling factor ABC transporter ATP-binding protein [Methanocorpusculum sp.]|nr:energy-coupling factor ABC transporter ATP-binding protein [Methanocorpusculum sp.]
MIEIENLRHGVLDIPSLRISAGLTVVSGKNGAGKTTLLKICSGLLLPAEGSVRVDLLPPRSVNAGYVSEFPDRHLLFPIVFDEIASPLRFSGISPGEIEKRVLGLAESAGISHLLTRECRTLSGGEKILVGVVTAIIDNPVLLVLDEPDSHLDPETVEELRSFISSKKIPYVIWSSHSKTLCRAADSEVRL